MPEPGTASSRLRSARVAQAPNPERAERLAENVLAALSRDRLLRLEAERPEALADALLALCGIAPFLAPVLQRHPDWLFSLLAEDLGRASDKAQLTRRLDDALAASASDEETTLRRFKYYELARITLRDCIPELLPLPNSGETR